jgi:hypothetical protein
MYFQTRQQQQQQQLLQQQEFQQRQGCARALCYLILLKVQLLLLLSI